MNTEQFFESGWQSRERMGTMRSIGTAGTFEGLGTARAARSWTWASARLAPLPQRVELAPCASGELRQTATSASAVRIPERVLRTMREAAWSTGRTESEIWAEAAREWLFRRVRDDEPQPPTPAAAALRVPRVAQAWHAIDALLAELRGAPCSEPAITSPAA